MPVSTAFGSISWQRRALDVLTHRLVSAGGATVLAAITVMFAYLAWIVAPMFAAPSIQHTATIVMTPRSNVLLDVNENGTVAARFGGEGVIEFFNLSDGTPLSAFALGAGIQTAVAVRPGNDLYVALDESNRLWVLRAEHKQARVGVELEANLNVLNEIRPEMEGRVASLDASLIGQKLQIVVSGSSTTLFTFDTQNLAWVDKQALALGAGITNVLLGPRQQWLYTVSDARVLKVHDLTRPDHPIVLQTPISDGERRVLSVTPLAGRYSLLVADSQQRVTHWSVVQDQLGMRVLPIRQREMSAPVLQMVAEPRRKGYYVLSGDGQLQSFYSTSSDALSKIPTVLPSATRLALSGRATVLVGTLKSDELGVFEIDNEHPEISFEALWHEVWYEGYAQPVRSWQSSSADDVFEPKFSLAPLLFGTIKAAFYALLIATPLAVLGAIYTAYFMSSRTRAYIKPVIEVMAALPTVILGFIGGLWLAPLIEQNLAAVLTAFVSVGVGLCSVAVLWLFVPQNMNIRSGTYLVIAIPLILAAVALGFAVGPDLESLLFNGDARTWLRDVAGLQYAQRNALVVGMMMGMAVIPAIFTLAEDAIHGVPQHLVQGSLALGATPWQTLRRVVLLSAAPGIFAAVMIGTGRAIGETMIVLMATGNTPIMEFNLFEGMRTLAANIAVETPESEVNSSHYRILFLTALTLFVMTFLFNTIAEVVRQRLRYHYGRL